jgi:hypothetical protein
VSDTRNCCQCSCPHWIYVFAKLAMRLKNVNQGVNNAAIHVMDHASWNRKGTTEQGT